VSGLLFRSSAFSNRDPTTVDIVVQIITIHIVVFDSHANECSQIDAENRF